MTACKTSISFEGILTRIRHMPKTIECGIHSGIPLCCVKFYANTWMFSTDDSDLRQSHRQLILRTESFLDYIPCPACCKNFNWVAVKPCPEGSCCYHADEQAE